MMIVSLDAPFVRKAFEDGDYMAVLKRLDQEPPNLDALPKALRGLALLTLCHLKRKPEAQALLDDLPDAADLHDGAALRDCAIVCLSLGRLEKAEAYFRAALDVLGHDSWSQAHLGAICTLTGRHEEALPYLEQAAVDLPEESAVALNLAIALLSLKRAPQALDVLDKASQAPGSDSHNFRHIHYRALMECGAFDRVAEMARARFGQADSSAQKIEELRKLASANYHDEAEKLLLEALDDAPDDIDLLLLQASFLEVGGRYVQAGSCLRRALEIDKDRMDIWLDLLGLMIKQYKSAQDKAEIIQIVQDCMDEAVRCHDPDNAEEAARILSGEAQILEWQGDVSGAEEKLRTACARAPKLGQPLVQLGQLLVQTGKLDEATACFTRLRENNPVLSWNLMLQINMLPDDEKALDRLEEMAKLPSLAGPQRSSVLFNLAKAWEMKKDYGRAFALAERANEADKRHIHYHPDVHRKGVDAVISHFTADFFKRCQGYGLKTQKPVFVLGMPRSGTTLTEQLLASHSKVFGAGELDIIPVQIQRLVAWENKLGSGMSYPECLYDLTQHQSVGIANRLLGEFENLVPEERREDVVRIIDKLPHNFENIGLIKLLFPQAKIIHLVREDRDVALSNYFANFGAKFGGMGYSADLGWIGEQLVDHRRIMEHWRHLFRDDIFDVVYEDLVEDTPGVTREMLAFIGLAWEPQVLDYQKLDRSVKTASVWQVRQSVYKTSREKWRNYERHLKPLDDSLAQVVETPAAQSCPPWEPGRFFKAMGKLEANDYEAAERAFQAILADMPDHAAACHMLGIAKAALGKKNDALYYLKLAYKQRPGYTDWVKNYIGILKQFGMEREASHLAHTLEGQA